MNGIKRDNNGLLINDIGSTNGSITTNTSNEFYKSKMIKKVKSLKSSKEEISDNSE